MNIIDFISKYKNHPILFIGTGMSLRYLKNSYTWDNLLEKIAYDFSGNDEYYLDIKSKCYSDDNKCNYLRVAEILESDFNSKLENDRNGRFKEFAEATKINESKHWTYYINRTRLENYLKLENEPNQVI